MKYSVTRPFKTNDQIEIRLLHFSHRPLLMEMNLLSENLPID